ncbi:Transport protein [Ceratobasidium theobromae]|uniref:Trafficking protein particle complex subunit n=1 Tax=Ceratobasidium theobromae TaxID=1582974 RepID=A0A5N5QVF6_9AGAM|nr:Transport protein [Ceratobasidium theobromae]
MAIYSLWIINKAGGLVYQREFADGLAKLTSNEYLVLAGTLHGIHAITSRLSPINGPSPGAHVIESESFKISILLTATGKRTIIALDQFGSPALLARVYEAYADAVMKNPFHTPEMPIRSAGFDTRVAALIGGG